MSKGSGTKEIKKEGHDHQQQQPQQHQQQQHSNPSPKGAKGAPNAVAGGCVCWGCKKDSKQFNFCLEHYDHFKFGLIKKTGEQVSDYEKKFEHYQAHLKRRSAHKVA